MSPTEQIMHTAGGLSPPAVCFFSQTKNRRRGKNSAAVCSFDLLDDNFMQPHPCGKEEFEQIEAIIKKMINDGIISKNTEEK